MNTPSQFAIQHTFKHRRPEYVRTVATDNGFGCMTAQNTSRSEIWTKRDGSGGHWIIRIDSMGHKTSFHFGARPHYHKNWVESDALIQQYLHGFVPDASVYSDAGLLIGTAGGDDLTHPDSKAKQQHIPR